MLSRIQLHWIQIIMLSISIQFQQYNIMTSAQPCIETDQLHETEPISHPLHETIPTNPLYPIQYCVSPSHSPPARLSCSILFYRLVPGSRIVRAYWWHCFLGVAVGQYRHWRGDNRMNLHWRFLHPIPILFERSLLVVYWIVNCCQHCYCCCLKEYLCNHRHGVVIVFYQCRMFLAACCCCLWIQVPLQIDTYE